MKDMEGVQDRVCSSEAQSWVRSWMACESCGSSRQLKEKEYNSTVKTLW